RQFKENRIMWRIGQRPGAGGHPLAHLPPLKHQAPLFQPRLDLGEGEFNLLAGKLGLTDLIEHRLWPFARKSMERHHETLGAEERGGRLRFKWRARWRWSGRGNGRELWRMHGNYERRRADADRRCGPWGRVGKRLGSWNSRSRR